MTKGSSTALHVLPCALDVSKGNDEFAVKWSEGQDKQRFFLGLI